MCLTSTDANGSPAKNSVTKNTYEDKLKEMSAHMVAKKGINERTTTKNPPNISQGTTGSTSRFVTIATIEKLPIVYKINGETNKIAATV